LALTVFPEQLFCPVWFGVSFFEALVGIAHYLPLSVA